MAWGEGGGCLDGVAVRDKDIGDVTGRGLLWWRGGVSQFWGIIGWDVSYRVGGPFAAPCVFWTGGGVK